MLDGPTFERERNMTQANEPTSNTAGNVWELARRLDMYRMTEAELDALIERRDGLTAEAAQYVRDLRAGLAAGHVC